MEGKCAGGKERTLSFSHKAAVYGPREDTIHDTRKDYTNTFHFHFVVVFVVSFAPSVLQDRPQL